MLNSLGFQALKLRWLPAALVWLACGGAAVAQGTTDAARQAAEQAAKQISQQATGAAKGADATRLNLTIGLATPGSQAPPVWNQPFKQIANIDWSTPVSPRLVNLGGDRFLFETRQGIVQWDFATLQSQPLSLPASASGTLTQLVSGYNTYAKLGGVASGTVFLASTSDKNRSSLLWWSPAKRAIAASLPIPGQADWASVVQIATHHVLLCDKKAGASVVRLTQRGGEDILAWVDASDPAAQAGLLAREVVGRVKGFDYMERPGTSGVARRAWPVFFDVAKCQWDMYDPPADLKPYFEKKTQRDIKPYFLADGSVLVPELSYRDGEHPRDIQSAYLWTPGTDQWKQLAATSGSGNRLHRVGQTEPVFATGFQSSVVEFFNTATLQWVRSVESLQISQYDWAPKVQLEPLNSGKALVIVSDINYQGTIGVMTPARGNSPLGYVRTPV